MKKLIINYYMRGKKQLYIATFDKKTAAKQYDTSNVLKLINKSYQFMYDPKKDMLLYNNGFKRKEMRVYDKNWGNIVSALNDLHDKEWIKNNEVASRVAKIDPENFNEMQEILTQVLQAIDAHKKDGSN